MKIAYIIPSLINQGPIIVVHSLVKYLKDKVEQIDVYYFDDKIGMQFDCSVHQINEKQTFDFDSYDIIHSHCLRPDRYVVRWKHLIQKTKIITTLHQDTFVTFSFQYNKLFASLATSYWIRYQKKFDGIIAISNQLRDKYKSRVGDKITTIYNGCNVQFDNSKLNNSIVEQIQLLKCNHFKIIGTYAYITKRKGLIQILNALLVLPDFAFVIIGEGPELKILKEKVIQMKLTARVIFFNYQNEPYNYLQFFDVFVIPSYSEGFGLSMVEAALAKKSIVCSDIASFHEIFDDEDVLFFKLDDTVSLSKSIFIAHNMRLTKGENAYKVANNRFIASTMGRNHLEYYNKMIINNY